MKNSLLKLLIIALTFAACQDSSEYIAPDQEIIEVDMSDFFVYTDQDDLANKSLDQQNDRCHTMKVLNWQLKEDPGLEKRMYDIEKHTRIHIASKAPEGKGKPPKDDPGDGTTDPPPPTSSYDDLEPHGNFNANTIPVVFHVIYKADSENIPDSQLEDQINSLNIDFNGNNPKGGPLLPGNFGEVEASIGVNFSIAQVIRVKNNKKRSWRPDDSMKFSSSGGSDAVDPHHYLNVWVVNSMPYMGGYIIGYAQFPGGNWATDGIVLDHRFTGNTNYSTGRTATHEIGHWMNLRHIWGDGGCGVDDFVDDTPLSDRYNRGCPIYPTVHCGTPDMTMNFMDYSDDPCLNMFTVGQKGRMSAVFTDSGFRKDMNVDIPLSLSL